MTGNRTLITKGAEGLELTLFLSDLPGSLANVGIGESNVNAGNGNGQVIALHARQYQPSATKLHNIPHWAVTHSRVTLLGLLGVAREDNEALLVRLKTLDIERLALLAQVPSPVVNNDTDTTRLLLADTGLLQLSEGETPALTDLAVVTDGLGMDGGAEVGEGADAKGCSLGLAGLTTADLATGLVEPGADACLPVLTEVILVEDCKLTKNMSSFPPPFPYYSERGLNEPLLCPKPMV